MIGKGQAEVASMATTKAPGMYVEMEQDENVARGYVKVTEIIAYDATKEPRRHMPEKEGETGEIMKDKEGNILYVEISRKPCFCQTPEDEAIYNANNPKARIESFGIQLLKSTAIKKLDDPENMKQFPNSERHQPIIPPAMEDLTEEPTWRQQASKLGIKMYQRKKEDVLIDIVTALSKE